MTLNLEDLELEDIRDFMFKEFEEDETEEKVYISPRLKDECKEQYIKIMKKAIEKGNDESLANELEQNNCLKTHEQRKLSSGKIIMVKIPITATNTLAEGEFNRFYIRALCSKAIKDNFQIEAYRAKEVARSRPESEEVIGKIIDPQELLADLRINIGETPDHKMPGGPNSGISVKKRI